MFAPTLSVPQIHPQRLPERLEPVLAPRELGKADILYYQGDEAEGVFRIDEGLVKLSLDLPSGKERILGIAGPGDFIGSLAPGQRVYGETSTALSPRVRLSASAHRDALAPLLHQAAGTQLERLRETLEDGELPVPARLARTFLRLGERFGALSETGAVHLTLPLTHDTLAAMIGAARETTTATLGEMREAGALSGTRGRYHYHLERLSAYALEHGAR